MAGFRTAYGASPRRVVAILAAMAIALNACGGERRANPDGGIAGTVTLRFDDPAGALGPHQAVLRPALEAAFTRADAALSVGGVTVTVTPDPKQVIPELGVGGVTPDRDTVNLSVDPGFAGFPDSIVPDLQAALTHELHHVSRIRQRGYGTTLLEAMVSEGLADRFTVELLGVEPPRWSLALTPAQSRRYLALARATFDAPTYDHGAWFFGTTATIPRWTGYSLGYQLIDRYIASHPDATAAGLARESVESFRP